MSEQIKHPRPLNSPSKDVPTNKLLNVLSWAISSENSFRTVFGRIITGIQISADALTIILSYLASYFFYTSYLKGWSPQTLPEFITLSVVIAALYIFIIDRVGLYRREISLLNIKELRGMFYVGLYAAAAILSASFYIRSISLSRITFTTALAITPVALYIQRQLFYKIHLLFHQRGWSQTRVFIYGAGQIGKHIAQRLFESPSLGMLPIGFLDDDKTKLGQNVRWLGVGPKNGLPILGGEEWLLKCKEFGVDKIIIALPSALFEYNQKLVELCAQYGIQYLIVPNAYEKFIQDVEMFEIGGIPILRRREHPKNYLFLFWKRTLDFFLSLLAIALLSPLYMVLGILIKLDSKGPIIFKQKRVGLNGVEFSFYKFRSMYIDAPVYAHTPSNPTDERITKMGRWLRRTSLDELPQLFNVLRGDMSLVGPRPEMPFIVAQYGPLEKRRLEMKPGITGVWQISAARGEPIHYHMEYDLFYLANQSFLLDLAIIIKTILSVIRGVGAI